MKIPRTAASPTDGLISRVPVGMDVKIVGDAHSGCALFSAKRELLEKGRSSKFKLNKLSRFLALRKQWVWSYPQFGRELSELPGEQSDDIGMCERSDGTQFLLWEREDKVDCLLLPLVDGDARASIQSCGDSLRLAWSWEPEGCDVQDDVLLAVLAWGGNPLELTRRAMKTVAARIKTFRLRTEKRTPDFLRFLGWCTWDAFYRNIDEKKVLDGLASFEKGGVRPGFMVLDDGWQDADKDESLLSFASDRMKFPNGITSLVEKAKAEHGVKRFGVWHALEGYWKGVSPRGVLGKRYPLLKNHRVDPPDAGRPEKKLVEHNLVEPESAARFYDDYYAALRKAGVDMVKADNQSGLDVFVKGKRGRVASMRKYQEALQGAAQNFFLGNCINCMSNGSDALFNMTSSNLIRSSNDYFPSRPLDAQRAHLVNNAMNAIWFSNFAIPDWDMFQSHGPCAEFHAAARSLSGGPVCLCDEPGKQNFSIIKKLCVSKSQVLRFDEPALPLPECVYVDPLKTASVLKIANRRGAVAALGLFNCSGSGLPLKTSFKPRDIDFLKGRDFAVFLHKTGEAAFAKAGESIEIELESEGWEIATIAPLENGMAPLGLAGKYAGAAALLSWRWQSEKVFSCALADGGEALFLSKKKPKAVFIGRKKLRFRCKKNGLLSITAPEGEPCEIAILL